MRENALEAIALRRSQSLTLIVQKELERMIVDGEVCSGERLNEQALAQRFSVSRGPVREAMRALECAGLVSAQLNQGFFVREISPEEIAEIYDVRSVVYGFVCARLAKAITGDELADLETHVRRMDDAIAAGDAAAYYQLNIQFHDASVRYARHQRASQTYQSLVNETHLCRQRSLDKIERMAESNAEHRALVQALGAGDAETARRLGQEHALGGRRRWEEMLAEDGATPASGAALKEAARPESKKRKWPLPAAATK